jgi:3-oxoacyl-[acyl-carrier-protein] synthase II
MLPEDGDLQLPDGATRYDLGSVWGHGSGALGVLQVAAAVGWFGSGRTAPVHAVTGGTADDPAAGIGLLPPHRTERDGR